MVFRLNNNFVKRNDKNVGKMSGADISENKIFDDKIYTFQNFFTFNNTNLSIIIIRI